MLQLKTTLNKYKILKVLIASVLLLTLWVHPTRNLILGLLIVCRSPSLALE